MNIYHISYENDKAAERAMDAIGDRLPSGARCFTSLSFGHGHSYLVLQTPTTDVDFDTVFPTAEGVVQVASAEPTTVPVLSEVDSGE